MDGARSIVGEIEIVCCAFVVVSVHHLLKGSSARYKNKRDLTKNSVQRDE